MTTNKRPFLENIHLFRAFAITNVMFVHLWSQPGYEGGLSLANLCRAVFFGNSTIYFIFISGFLFEYLSTNFDLKTYYEKKIKFVVVPYMLLSMIMTIRNCFIEYCINNQNITIYKLLSNYAFNVLYGKAESQFWYIPFISIVFIVSPLLLHVPKKYDKILIVLSICLPILGTRTGINVTIWQYLYFLPVYVFGFYISKYYSTVENKLIKYSLVSFFIFIISTVFLFKIYSHNIKLWFFSLKESAFYVQKISMTLFMIVQLKKVTSNKIFDTFANYSFGLFFLHCSFVFGTKNYLLHFIDAHIRNFSFILSFILALVYITITVLLCWLTKKVLGKSSRYVIGA